MYQREKTEKNIAIRVGIVLLLCLGCTMPLAAAHAVASSSSYRIEGTFSNYVEAATSTSYKLNPSSPIAKTSLAAQLSSSGGGGSLSRGLYPELQLAMYQDYAVTLVFNRILDRRSVSDVDDFTLTAIGAPVAVTNVTVSGTTVILELEEKIARDTWVELKYERGRNELRGLNKKDVDDFVIPVPYGDAVVREDDPESVVLGSPAQAGDIPGSGKCPAHLKITQLLKVGARDGQYDRYTKAIVQEVKVLQQHMSCLGHRSGPEDGIFGRLTRAGVRSLQKELGVTVDGIVGPETRAAINASCSGVSDQTLGIEIPSSEAPTQNTCEFPHNAKQGDTGEYVAHIQQFLVNQNLLKAEHITGTYDRVTGEATRTFQTKYPEIYISAGLKRPTNWFYDFTRKTATAICSGTYTK